MLHVPSPINPVYDIAYQAKANESGRMQYYKILPGKNRQRISRGEFIDAYNKSTIIAFRALQNPSLEGLFQIEFMISH